MTPLDHFAVLTPLGPATCIGICADLDDPEWACWIERTQEMWWFGNRLIRRRPNVTNDRAGVSPFDQLNPPLLVQIERYKKNGWLPPGYDPSDVATWSL